MYIAGKVLAVSQGEYSEYGVCAIFDDVGKLKAWVEKMVARDNAELEDIGDADEIITSIKWGEDEYGLPEPTFMMANGKPSKWPCEHYFIEEFDFNPDEVSQ